MQRQEREVENREDFDRLPAAAKTSYIVASLASFLFIVMVALDLARVRLLPEAPQAIVTIVLLIVAFAALFVVKKLNPKHRKQE